ncbi:MAG: hypothetical protein AAF757_04770 [Cyanobacteria bacterium P01_D01_bin.116]
MQPFYQQVKSEKLLLCGSHALHFLSVHENFSVHGGFTAATYTVRSDLAQSSTSNIDCLPGYRK